MAEDQHQHPTAHSGDGTVNSFSDNPVVGQSEYYYRPQQDIIQYQSPTIKNGLSLSAINSFSRLLIASLGKKYLNL